MLPKKTKNTKLAKKATHDVLANEASKTSKKLMLIQWQTPLAYYF